MKKLKFLADFQYKVLVTDFFLEGFKMLTPIIVNTSKC